MWPTSIAVWKCSAPPQFGQRSPSAGLAQVGEARLEVAAGLDAAQVPAVAVRAGDELPVAQRLVGDDLARRSRPGRASRRIGAERGADLVVGRRPRRPRRAPPSSFAGSSRSSPRTSASTTVPSSFVTGIAFDVAATSIAEELGERLERRHARRLDLLGRGERLAGTSARAGRARATSRSAAKSPFSQVTSVFSPEPDGARKSIDSLPPIIPDSACDVVVRRARSARRSGGRRRAALGSSRRARPRRGRTSTSPS